MSSDDINQTPDDQDVQTTQPTITAVFRLLREVQAGLARLEERQSRFEERLTRLEERQTRLEEGQARLEARQAKLEAGQAKLEEGQAKLNSRFDAVESRLDREFARIDARFAEMSEQMKLGFQNLSDKIERSRLHSEADYHDLLRRIRDLESKAS